MSVAWRTGVQFVFFFCSGFSVSYWAIAAQYNSLASVAGLKKATDEGSLPEIAQYSPYYLPLKVIIASKGSNLYILFTLLKICFF